MSSSVASTVLANPALYHIGASYLTGAPRANFNDEDYARFLGRLGTFVSVLFPKATLCSSPHITAVKIQSYEDSSIEWKQLLEAFKARQIDLSQVAVTTFTSMDDGDIKAVRDALKNL